MPSAYKICLFISLLILLSCNIGDRDKTPANYTQYVDPFTGTGAHGHTFPGATLPNGMVQVSPDNGKAGWDWSSGYHYSSDTIAGFSMLHLSGTGTGDLLDVCLLPATKKVETDTVSEGNNYMRPYWSTFSHNKEIAHPGYYKVYLESSDIWAEMTCAERTGFFRFTFPESPLSTIFLDLFHSYNVDKPTETHIKIVNDNLITGYRFSKGWTPNQKVFFAIELSNSFYNVFLIDDDGRRHAEKSEITGKGVRAAFEYATDDAETILAKVGISSVSEQNAFQNMRSEIPGWDFEAVKEKAHKIWNKELSVVEVLSDNNSAKRVFYTALYHSLISPNIYSDVKGEYIGPDEQLHVAKDFTHHYTFSLQNTFRGLHPLLTIIKPKKVNDYVESMMTHYDEYGLLPYWTLWGGETYSMVGYHSAPVLLDAYKKGLIEDASGDEIYKALKKSAMGNDSLRNFEDIKMYVEHGFLPEDLMREKYYGGKPGHTESVSRTLEWAYDDWCVAQFAKEFGTDGEYVYFMQRSSSYKNVFDTAKGFMRPRNSDGSWVTPFSPLNASHQSGFTEGNAWQYSWFVPHDIENLVELMGGKDNFEQKLDTLFHLETTMGKKAFQDVSGLIGQYAHGYEPCHHIAYLYNYVDANYKTQMWTDVISDSLYTDAPDGLYGNENCGQMSAWYILSSFGFYPVNPANSYFDLGNPAFEEIVINLNNGKSFNIKATNYSDKNVYVQSVSLNGELLENSKISYDQIMKGGELEYVMGIKPL